MQKYIVEYRADGIDESEYFVCQADDIDHAIEQCEDAYKNSTTLTVFGVVRAF